MKLASCVVAVSLFASIAGADPKKPKPPHGATSISIDYTWQSFSSDAAHYDLAWSGSGYTAGTRTIDGKLVDALYASLTGLKDVPEPLRCMSHTDDYPAFTVTITGDEPLTIASSSNCHAYVPWNVTREGKPQVQAQFSGAIWGALSPILAAAADRWKQGGNSPQASMGFGFEMVGLGEYKAGDTSSSDAAKCAHSLESDASARTVFGQVQVSELELRCVLRASPDCSEARALATFTWEGVSSQVEVACTAGQVSMPNDALAELTAVAAFVHSKPVRALVKTSTGTPRMWNNGNWSVESPTDGMPMLAWTPKTKVIEARGFGGVKPLAAFWKELGIDPKPLVKKRDGFTELDAKLDFAGKLVK